MAQQQSGPRVGGHPAGAITAQRMAEGQRLGFLPRHFGKFFIAAESGVDRTMRRLCPQYPGGPWEFFALSNGGALPAALRRQRLLRQLARVCRWHRGLRHGLQAAVVPAERRGVCRDV